MGRTWKFTEQIYEELGEAIDKKIETRFDTGVIAGGPMGMFGNPFEKYADEINMGISKMNSYVDMINEADGFNRTKLDRVFNEVAEIDRNYGNQISKCIDNLEHYKNVLYQLEVVMEQALVNSTNGNAVFDFDREKFQEKVADDKHAMDIAYVDRILEKDASEITYEEYYSIAVMLGNQPTGDTELLEHIMNSGYLWNFTDVWEGEFGMSPEAVRGEGQYSNAVFMPNEKYTLLEAVLKEYANMLVINKPQDNVSTNYLDMLNSAIMYTNFFDMAWEHMCNSQWGYPIDNKKEYEKLILKDLFTIEYGSTSIGGNVGFLVEIKNCNGFGAHDNLEILKPFNSQSAPSGMDALENMRINHYLKLDMSDRVYLSSEIISRILEMGKGKIEGDKVGFVVGVIADYNGHKEQQKIINKFEEAGSLGSAIQTLDMYCGIGNYKGEKDSAEITVYPTSVTEKRIEMLNRLLADQEVSYLQNIDMSKLPSGRFTMNFAIEHIDEADKILDKIEIEVRNHTSYSSLLQLLEAEYAN